MKGFKEGKVVEKREGIKSKIGHKKLRNKIKPLKITFSKQIPVKNLCPMSSHW